MLFVTRYSQRLFTAQTDGQRNQLTFPDLPFRLFTFFLSLWTNEQKLSGDFMPEHDE